MWVRYFDLTKEKNVSIYISVLMIIVQFIAKLTSLNTFEVTQFILKKKNKYIYKCTLSFILKE